MSVSRLSLALLPLVLAACGGAAKTTAPPPPPASVPAKPSRAVPGALQAEAQSAATGDIPDDQVFLVFRNRAAGWSMKYPEGWAQSGSGKQVAFRDKNNVVRVVVEQGAAPTAASVRRDLAGARIASGPQTVSLRAGPAAKVVYSTESAPNAVTGKRVTLVVDRYYVAHGARRAIVDLGTPQGVDNVDAYRLMIESFRWR